MFKLTGLGYQKEFQYLSELNSKQSGQGFCFVDLFNKMGGGIGNGYWNDSSLSSINFLILEFKCLD